MFDYEKLVGSIYDCAANPELWPDTLGSIRDAVGGAYALVGFVDTSEMIYGRPPFTVRRNSAWDEDRLVQLEAILNMVPDGGGMFDTGVDVAWTQLTRLPIRQVTPCSHMETCSSCRKAHCKPNGLQGMHQRWTKPWTVP